MRRLLALFGLLAILAAPYAELAHGHDHNMGESHSDCPACHVKSNPADQGVVATTPVGQLSFHLAPPARPQPLLPVADPLREAPKTSPPRVCA